MEHLSNHPAIRLGIWLKTARQAKGIVKRLFAGQIALTPAEYTEVEAGVIHWITPKQERAIASSLDLNPEQVGSFNGLLKQAQSKTSLRLTFANVFTREELEPIRCRRVDESFNPNEFERETILSAVFQEA